jgi:hypothetical protein
MEQAFPFLSWDVPRLSFDSGASPVIWIFQKSLVNLTGFPVKGFLFCSILVKAPELRIWISGWPSFLAAFWSFPRRASSLSRLQLGISYHSGPERASEGLPADSVFCSM